MELESLIKPGQRLSVLAGSGVSLDAPSSLPTGWALTKSLLRSLLPEELHARIGELTDPQDEARFLRFEQLMTYVQAFDPELRVLDALGTCDRPNPLHQLLAALVVRGDRVFTTNFDSLIEHALAQRGLVAESIVPVIHEADWRRDAQPSDCRVFKLHGSIIDVRTGASSRQSVQATLRQIGRAKDHATTLEPWKLQRLREALIEGDLLVVGYSGLDDFDVVPALRGIASRRRLIWIDHESQQTAGEVEAQRVTSDSVTAASARLQRVLQSIALSGRREGEVWLLRMNTGQFLQHLSRHLAAEVAASTIATPTEPVQAPALQLPRVGPARRWYVAADIYSHLDPQLSIDLLRRALPLTQQERDPLLQARCENLLGRQCEALYFRTTDAPHVEHMRWWHAAVSHYAQARRLAGDVDDHGQLELSATSLVNEASLYLSLGGASGPRKALALFERARGLFDRLNDDELSGWLENQCGAACMQLGELEQATKHFAAACRHDRRVGNVERLGVHLANLGACLVERGLADAIAPLTEAAEIETTLGQYASLQLCLQHLGNACAAQQRWDEAGQHYERALSLSTDNPKGIRQVIERSLQAVRREAQARLATGRE